MIPSIWWTKLYRSCEYTRVLLCNCSCLTKCRKCPTFWCYGNGHPTCHIYLRNIAIITLTIRPTWYPCCCSENSFLW